MAIPPLRVLIHSTLVDATNNMLPNLRTYIIWNVRFGSYPVIIPPHEEGHLSWLCVEDGLMGRLLGLLVILGLLVPSASAHSTRADEVGESPKSGRR
jgi:hypothetical protein